MKKATLLILLFGAITCCTKEEEQNEVLNTNEYKLIEILADPGDGSGTFQPVSSSKTIELKTNGTVLSNGSICDMSTSAGTASTGTYSFADSTITPANCSTLPFKIIGKHLIIYYPCIEPCQAKYERI